MRRVGQYAVRRGLGTWEITFAGRRDSFVQQQGAEYVVYLLLHPPPEPMHAVSLALAAHRAGGDTAFQIEDFRQRSLGLDDADAVQQLRDKARALEAVLKDRRESEGAKAEARQQREQILDYLRKNPWRSRDGAQKCVRAITIAMKRLHEHLAESVDAEGNPHPVLQEFGEHLFRYMLVPSGRGGGQGGARAFVGGCFTYEPPPGVVWARLK
jgi:hypothetical protein